MGGTCSLPCYIPRDALKHVFNPAEHTSLSMAVHAPVVCCLQGTNTGVQLRKLYNPEQFAGAAILGLYDTTYGADRSHVCAFGIEANPVHSKYLATLNAYFSTASYQGIVIKEAAASIKTGTATFHQDHTNPFEGGASLAQGSWQSKGNTPTSHVTVPTFDLPAFLVGVVRPLVLQIEQETGKRPPVGMKLDVEGEEYALLPAMITNGALCDLAMVYIEPHGADFRVGAGAAVNMTFDDIMTAFNNMRKANPRCDVQVKIMDDETFADAYKTIPLPLGSGIAS